ncbi:ARHGEF12 [Acanthosepion pharaonis]|uniref:ARHGEF12 n=1 Tax=Acanthosepion pharaonis TaxID=158019 RepID=A0A812CW69_ACAPH|nr:ARHGEF12 [Sepia pharaonis]
MESKDNSSSNKRVTAPQPVDQEKEEDMRQQKIQTIEKMLSLQQEECEKVRKIYNKYPSEKVQGELNEKEKTVRTLENQLRQMTGEYQTDYTGLGLPETLPARLPGGSKHIKHGSVPASIYKTRDVVDIRDISVSRSKSDASSKHSQVAAGGGSDPSYPLLPSGYHQRDFIKERSSLPISSSDISSSCDSPQASPSNSPTPIHPTNMNWSNVDAEDFASSSHIMCFEDDDQDEESQEENEDYKPFQHLQEVEKRKAYLSILLHYLISNDDPSALFFYVITEIYASAPGNPKELRKWAYEIYSTFLIPEAPLRVTVDEKFIKTIDDVLNTKSDKEDCLRCIFQQSRYDAQSAVKCMLKEFWNKQKLGLGNIYGVDELKLNLDKSQEAKIIEKHLMPHMENFMEDRAKSARDQAQGWALATFLRHVGVPKPSSHSNILERVQSFVMKERKEKGIKLPGSRSKTKTHRNHQYVPQHYYVLTECVHCHSIIWGVGYQGYQCSNCEQNVHKQCIELVDVSCAPVKKKNTKRTSGLMDKWGRKPSSISDRRESCSPTQVGVSAFQSSNTDEDCDPVNNLVQRFEKKSPGDSEDERHKRGTDLGRSESLKDRPDPKGDRRTRRAKSDVEMDENTMKALNNSGSSSTSSLQSGRFVIIYILYSLYILSLIYSFFFFLPSSLFSRLLFSPVFSFLPSSLFSRLLISPFLFSFLPSFLLFSPFLFFFSFLLFSFSSSSLFSFSSSSLFSFSSSSLFSFSSSSLFSFSSSSSLFSFSSLLFFFSFLLFFFSFLLFFFSFLLFFFSFLLFFFSFLLFFFFFSFLLFFFFFSFLLFFFFFFSFLLFFFFFFFSFLLFSSLFPFLLFSSLFPFLLFSSLFPFLLFSSLFPFLLFSSLFPFLLFSSLFPLLLLLSPFLFSFSFLLFSSPFRLFLLSFLFLPLSLSFFLPLSLSFFLPLSLFNN